MIKIIINGANGKMGQEAVKAIENEPDLTLVGQAGHDDDLASIIKESRANVVVDLTTASSIYKNMRTIIDAGAHPVIGTSGLTDEQIKEFETICQAKKLGGIIVPNFSIGAVLMMTLAEQAAKYMPHVEIIELHHDRKEDSPSGTAMKTANMLAAARQHEPIIQSEKETIPGARGATYEDIHIHAVRLPGLVAHQSVIFGGTSETLTIRHDSIHRESFMPGLCLACRKVGELDGLVYGLENIL